VSKIASGKFRLWMMKRDQANEAEATRRKPKRLKIRRTILGT
jgi:hypothetical protein